MVAAKLVEKKRYVCNTLFGGGQMSLAENIKRYRTDRKMSQEDLAEALNISRQSVSKWEIGGSLS